MESVAFFEAHALYQMKAATRDTYLRVIKEFGRFTADINHPTRNDVTKWLRYQRNELAISTARLTQKLAAMKTFYRILYEFEVSNTHLKELFPTPKRPPRKLPATTMGRKAIIHAHYKPVTAVGVRDLLIVTLLQEAGVKSHEIRGISLNCLVDSDTAILVGDQYRYIPVSRKIVNLIKYWIRLRKPWTRDRSHLFVTHEGHAFSSIRTVWNCTRRCFLAAQGIARKYRRASALNRPWSLPVSPARLRGQFIVDWLQAGADLRSIQEFLGIRNINSLVPYLAYDTRSIKKAHALRFSPHVMPSTS